MRVQFFPRTFFSNYFLCMKKAKKLNLKHIWKNGQRSPEKYQRVNVTKIGTISSGTFLPGDKSSEGLIIEGLYISQCISSCKCFDQLRKSPMFLLSVTKGLKLYSYIFTVPFNFYTLCRKSDLCIPRNETVRPRSQFHQVLY